MKRYAFLLVTALLGATGCANMDNLGRKLDIVSEHVGTEKPVYEGHITSAARIGAMTAVQFTDGKEFEVADCPSTLVPGDTVRIYKIEKGYAAHLWRDSQAQLKS
jgi:hypothetical protein